MCRPWQILLETNHMQGVEMHAPVCHLIVLVLIAYVFLHAPNIWSTQNQQHAHKYVYKKNEQGKGQVNVPWLFLVQTGLCMEE